MSDKCPKCGSPCLVSGDSWTKWECESYSEYGHMTEGVPCLRRRLAAANAKLAEMARLAEETRSEAHQVQKALAKANENLRDLCYEIVGARVGHFGDHRAYCCQINVERVKEIMATLPQPPKEADDAE